MRVKRRKYYTRKYIQAIYFHIYFTREIKWSVCLTFRNINLISSIFVFYFAIRFILQLDKLSLFPNSQLSVNYNLKLPRRTVTPVIECV